MNSLSAASPGEAKRLLIPKLHGTARLRLQQAFRLSSSALIDEPEEWPTQIIARLRDEKNPAVRRILKLVEQTREGCWLKPILAPLIAAGGPIEQIIDADAPIDDSRAFAWSSSHDRITFFSRTSFRTRQLSSDRELRRLELPIPWGRAAIANPPVHAVVNVAQRGFLLVNLQTAAAEPIHNEGVIEGVAISANGRCAVTTSVPSDWEYSLHNWNGPRTLRLFNLRKRSCVRTWQAHDAFIVDLALSADGRFLTTASFDQTVRLFDLQTGQMLRRWRSTRRMAAVAITPHGKRIAYVSEGVLTVRRRTGAVIARISHCGTERGCLALSEDGRKAVIVAEGDVSVIDLRNSKRFGPFTGTQPYPTSLAIDAKAHHAITGENGAQLVLWNLTKAGKPTHDASWIFGIWADRSEALVNDSDGLWLWDLTNGVRSLLRTSGSYQTAAAPSAGVWAQVRGGRIRIGKWGQKKTTLMLESKESFLGLRTLIQISRNGTRLVVPVHPQGCRVFNLADRRLVWSREKMEIGVQASLSPTGRYLFLSSLMGTLEIVDLESGESTHRNLPQPGQTKILFPLEDDRVLLLQGEDTAVLNWKANSLRTAFRGRPSSISDDGQWLATQSGTRKLNLWKLPEESRVATFTSDTPILHTALSPNGRFLIAGDQRGCIYVLQSTLASSTITSLAF